MISPGIFLLQFLCHEFELGLFYTYSTHGAHIRHKYASKPPCVAGSVSVCVACV